MKKVLLYTLSGLLFFAPGARGQTWCWAEAIVGLGLSGNMQSNCVDNLGNLYSYSRGAASITVGGVTATGGKYLLKHKTATGAIDWAVGGIGGNYWGTFLTNDARGNIYMYCDNQPNNAFTLTKIDSFGSVIWSKSGIGVSSSTPNIIYPWNVATDTFGHIYVSGYLVSQKLALGTDTLLNMAPDSSCFVIKYDTMGNLIWHKQIYSPHYVYSPSLTVNSAGDLFISCLVRDPSVTILDTAVTLPITGSGVFVARFDSGLHLKWITANNRSNNVYMPLNVSDLGAMNIVKADDAGNAYLGGTYMENDTLGTIPVAYDTFHSKYVAKYRNTDGHVLWATTGGNPHSRGLYNLTTNSSGHSYCTFSCWATTSYFGDSTFTYTGGTDTVLDLSIISLDSNGKVACGHILNGTTGLEAHGIAVDNAGFAYFVGDFEGTVSFGDTSFTIALSRRYFASKYSCHCSCTPVAAPDSVSISVSPYDTICAGGALTFTATVFGGPAVSYQWVVNGVYTGSGADTFTYTPGDGDSVRCIVSNSDPCAYSFLTSNTIVTHVIVAGSPGIVISAAPGDTVCAGATVGFSATTTWGGASPAYQWKVNGTLSGAGSSFSYVPANGDSVWCVFTTTFLCMPTPTVKSNAIKVVVKNCHVGINGVSKDFLGIYPNPAGNRLTVISDEGAYNSLVISNSMGQVLIVQPITSSQATIDLEALPPGLYYIRVSGDYGIKTEKFVKM